MRRTFIISVVPMLGLLAACSTGPSKVEITRAALVKCLNTPGAKCGDAFMAYEKARGEAEAVGEALQNSSTALEIESVRLRTPHCIPGGPCF